MTSSISRVYKQARFTFRKKSSYLSWVFYAFIFIDVTTSTTKPQAVMQLSG